MADMVNRPPHYTEHRVRCTQCGYEPECIELAQQMDFCAGNAFKYLWRLGRKDDRKQDLAKAAWYAAKARDLDFVRCPKCKCDAWAQSGELTEEGEAVRWLLNTGKMDALRKDIDVMAKMEGKS